MILLLHLAIKISPYLKPVTQGLSRIDELSANKSKKSISWTSNLSLLEKEYTSNTAQYDSKTATINNTTNNDYQY